MTQNYSILAKMNKHSSRQIIQNIENVLIKSFKCNSRVILENMFENMLNLFPSHHGEFQMGEGASVWGWAWSIQNTKSKVKLKHVDGAE